MVLIITLFLSFFLILIGKKLFNATPDQTSNKSYSPKPSYEELLHTNQWYYKRTEILIRDGYKCQWCNSTDNLEVHHKYYLKYPNGKKVNPWEYPNAALMTLCKKCHQKAHNKYKIKTYYTKNK